MKTKRIILLVLCVLCCLLQVACTNQRSKNTTRQEERKTESKPTTPPMSEVDTSAISVKKLGEIIEDFLQGYTVSGVYALGNEVVLIALEGKSDSKCVFLNVTTGIVEKEWAETNLLMPLECQVYDNYTVIYDSSNRVYIIDDKYEITNTVDISNNKYISNTTERSFCISPNMEKIYYYQTKTDNKGVFCGLYSTDVQGSTSEEILRIEGPESNVNWLNGITSIHCSFDESKLYFTGYYFSSAESNSMSNPCFGSINISDAIVDVQYGEKQRCKIFKGGCVFYDGLLEKDTLGSGNVSMFYDNGDKQTQILKNKNESQLIYISDYGNYLYACQAETYSKGKVCHFNKYNIKEKKWKEGLGVLNLLSNIIVMEKANRTISFSYINKKVEVKVSSIK